MLASAQPKPKPRKSIKAANRRVAAKIIRQVRAACVERDQTCRAWYALASEVGWCLGQLEWAHLGDYKRFKTRGKPAEDRHTTSGSLMLCRRHHLDYDAGRLAITALSERGADGPLEFRRV